MSRSDTAYLEVYFPDARGEPKTFEAAVANLRRLKDLMRTAEAELKAARTQLETLSAHDSDLRRAIERAVTDVTRLA